jgi:hypothetical protein
MFILALNILYIDYFLCGEWFKAYENWTQARPDAVNCFYL